MKFAEPWWLLGCGLALAFGALLIVSGLLSVRAIKRFGDEERIEALLTNRPGARRTLKGVLLVLAVACAFVAAAQPQYGRGSRLVPATNLDVVIVLDYSKSMYARDVAPSRIERAKTEVGRLIADLPGARFGAVAFAGDPLSFPLTSDGAAIAQFFRQLSPNDMPVGGTAIGRALEAGRESSLSRSLVKKTQARPHPGDRRRRSRRDAYQRRGGRSPRQNLDPRRTNWRAHSRTYSGSERGWRAHGAGEPTSRENP